MIDDYFKDILINIIEKTQKTYNFELIHYAILDNHFHFIIRTVEDGTTISRIMQYIKARFAETYNRNMDRKGTFWSERFKDVIVEEQEFPDYYLLWLLWYIGFNPVKKGCASSPEKYKYCSIRHYLEEHMVSTLKITLHQIYINLGNSFDERVKRFREWENLFRKRHAIPNESTYT